MTWSSVSREVQSPAWKVCDFGCMPQCRRASPETEKGSRKRGSFPLTKAAEGVPLGAASSTDSHERAVRGPPESYTLLCLRASR